MTLHFYFLIFLWCLKKVSSFWDTQSVKIKHSHHFCPYSGLGQRGLRLRLCWLPSYAIPVLNNFQIHNNNIDIPRTTNKQYYKIILIEKFLPIKTDIFRELLPNNTDFFQENCTTQYFFLVQMWSYSISLLTGISANSNFRTMFYFKKLKYTVDIY